MNLTAPCVVRAILQCLKVGGRGLFSQCDVVCSRVVTLVEIESKVLFSRCNIFENGGHCHYRGADIF